MLVEFAPPKGSAIKVIRLIAAGGRWLSKVHCSESLTPASLAIHRCAGHRNELGSLFGEDGFLKRVQPGFNRNGGANYRSSVERHSSAEYGTRSRCEAQPITELPAAKA
jgi:hypothetical protein